MATVAQAGKDDEASRGTGWRARLLLYVAFSAAVFVVLGSQPSLGGDHLTYIELADSIVTYCPLGGYWRETNSIRFYGVLLAYLQGWTGSYVLSMKLVLAVASVAYLFAAEAFFRLFMPTRAQAVVFALLSAFAVSFGISSWGVTDPTALLPRSLVFPLVMFATWYWFRFDGRPVKYLAFSFLALGSFVHLSVFHAIGLFALIEILDFAILRRGRIDRLAAAFVGGLVLATSVAFALEYSGLASKQLGTWLPGMLRAAGVNAPYIDTPNLGVCKGKIFPKTQPPRPAANPPAAAATPPAAPASPPKWVAPPASAAPAAPAPAAQAAPNKLTPKEAWDIELALRPWRNMPLPLVNVANVLSSSALILLLAIAGVVSRYRAGFTRRDRLMLVMFAAVPLFSFGPQTALWIARSFAPVYPITIEEVRAIGLVMIPALYFIGMLFARILATGGERAPLKAAALAAAVLVLPLTMKSLPNGAREGILSALMALKVVDPGSTSMVSNARAALGISATAPLYYSTRGVTAWLMANTPRGTRVLTDRDDMILMREREAIGPRQVVATTFRNTPAEKDLFLEVAGAMSSRDLPRLERIGAAWDVDYIVVPWKAPGAVYSDESFSIVPAKRARPATAP